MSFAHGRKGGRLENKIKNGKQSEYLKNRLEIFNDV